MATNSRIQAPQINLKERIAALEQRNTLSNSSRSIPSSSSSSSKPSGIPQLTANNALREKIAKFEKKGGIPVPRGRFGMGAPPVDSGKPRKQGELYGNRIPRAVTGSVPLYVKTGSGSQVGRRSVSLSVRHLDNDVSTPLDSRSPSPCTTDFDATSDGLLSPDSMRTTFTQMEESYGSPLSDMTDGQFSPHSEVSDLQFTQCDDEDASELIPQVIVTVSPPPPEDGSMDDSVPLDDVTTVPQSEIEEENELIDSLPQETSGDGQTLNGTIPAPRLDKEEVRPIDDVSDPPKPQANDDTAPSSIVVEEEGQHVETVIPSPKPVEEEHSSTYDVLDSPRAVEVEHQSISGVIASPEPGRVGEEREASDDVAALHKQELQPTESAVTSPKAEQEVESQPIVENRTNSVETHEAQDVEEVSISSPVSRSSFSSIRTLTPVSNAAPSNSVTEQAARPNVPFISLSPPSTTEDATSPLASSPQEAFSPQDFKEAASPVTMTSPHVHSSPRHAERAISPVSAKTSSSPTTPLSAPSSPAETQSHTEFPVESSGSMSPSPQSHDTQRILAYRRYSELDVPTNLKARLGNDPHFDHDAQRDDLLMADALIDQVLKELLPESNSSLKATVTSPPSETPESPYARLAYDLPDHRVSTPSSSNTSPPMSTAALLNMLSPLNRNMFSPSSSELGSPGQVMTAHRVAPVTDRGVPMFLPGSMRRHVDYSYFPPTPDPANAEFKESLPLAALSPISPSSRFRDPPTMASSASRATFRAVVRGRTKEPVSAGLPSFKHLGAPETPHLQKVKQPKRMEHLSQNTGELATLLQEAALLEDVLTQGELPDRLPQVKSEEEVSKSVEQVGTEPSGKQEMDKVDGRPSPDRVTVTQSKQSVEENDPTLVKFKQTFHLPLRKKTKHWKASSTHAILKDDLRNRPSLEAERDAGLSIPDPTFLQTDPAEDIHGGSKDARSRSPRPRLLSGIKKLAGSGSTKSLHTHGTHPRHSVSTSSELSSEDSMPIITPPDQSAELSDSRDGMSSDSNQGHGSNVAWPSSSPKRSGISRAATFAEKIWNRARTKSSVSTVSARESRDRIASDVQYDPLPTAKGSSFNLTTATPSLSSQENLSTYRLDTLPPSEPLFDAQSFDDSDMLSLMSLPNPYSPDPLSSMLSPSNGGRSPSMSVLTNPHSPRPTSDNESSISEASSSQIDPELFDAFPSVPQVVPPTQGIQRRVQPLPSIGDVTGKLDSLFTNPPGPQSATLPKRTTTLPRLGAAPHTAAVTAADTGFLSRAVTMPRQRPSVEHYPTRT